MSGDPEWVQNKAHSKEDIHSCVRISEEMLQRPRFCFLASQTREPEFGGKTVSKRLQLCLQGLRMTVCGVFCYHHPEKDYYHRWGGCNPPSKLKPCGDLYVDQIWSRPSTIGEARTVFGGFFFDLNSHISHQEFLRFLPARLYF